MKPFTLRPAHEADWARAWEIQRRAFRELAIRTWGSWDDDVQRRNCAQAWNPSQTQIVECDGASIGWVRVEHHPDHDWLDLIVVDPDYQTRGLGTEVMRTLLANAQARGNPLWLSVYRTNEARRLYARLGFAELPRDDIRVFMVFPPWPPTNPPRP